jgi:hypothetical protein
MRPRRTIITDGFENYGFKLHGFYAETTLSKVAVSVIRRKNAYTNLIGCKLCKS